MNILENPNIKFDYAGYFISDGKWIHPDRTEKTYELICVTHGVVHMFDEKTGNIRAEKGQVILLDKNTRHYGTCESENVRFYWVHFQLQNGNLPFSGRLFENFEQVYLFRELLHLCNLPQIPACAVNTVLVHILSELYRCETNSRFDRRGEEIYEWLRINASAALTVRTAAEHFGFSPDHLSRIVNKNFRCGAKELIVRFILLRAKELLCNTGLYAKEIAAQLDFPSDKAFIQFFFYHEGVYPEQFRKRFSRTHLNKK